MNIFVGQIYIEPGVNYPFSQRFQTWLGQELTKRVQPSQKFLRTYAEDFDLIFRVSAKSKIRIPEIKGPTVFKREKDVEFTIFLPHDGDVASSQNDYFLPIKFLLDSVVSVLQTLGIDASQVVANSAALIDHACSEPAMIAHRKSSGPRG